MTESAPYSGNERRRHLRRPVRLDAEVDLNASERLPVQILDFCEGGLFLAVSGSDDGSLVLEGRQVTQGTPLWVSFQIAVGSASRGFRVPVQVMRLVDAGMGVRFDPPQPTALAALQALALVSEAPGAGGRPDAGDILDGLHDHLSGWLKQTLRALFKSSVDDLFVQARDATSNEVQSECMDAMKDIERVSDKVSTECRIAVLGALGRLGPEGAGRREEPAPQELGTDSTNLTLVDTGSFDDWVTAKNIMNKAEPKLREDIFALSRRLSELCGRELDEFTNPVGIQQLGMQFNESLQNLGLPKRARKTIYRGFDEVFIASLPVLYRQLNDYLVDEGVNPSLERTTSTSKLPRRAPPAQAPPPTDAPPAASDDETGMTAAHCQAPTAAADGSNWAAYHGGATPAMDATQQAAPGIAPQAPPASMAGPPMAASAAMPAPQSVAPHIGMPAGTAPVAAPLSYAGGLRAPMPVAPVPQVPMQQAFSAARNLMGLRQAMASGQPLPSGERVAAPVHAAPTPQLANALTRLSRSSDFNHPTDARSMHLGQRLVASLAKDGIELSDPQREMMDVLSTLVEAMLVDPMIREPVKPRIKRLAVPMLKTAFEDASFFSDDAHPARQVVNRLGMMDLPARRTEGEEGDSLESNVDPLVDAIVNDDNAGATSFRAALPALDELLSRQSDGFEQRLSEVLRSPQHEEAMLSAQTPTQVGSDADIGSWAERAARLVPGDMVAFSAKGRRPDARTLAWVSEDRSLFVFTDRDGGRPASLSRSDLARRMSKGNIALLDTPDIPAMDRGMFNVLDDIHREVAEESKKDPVTGLPGLDHFCAQVEQAIGSAHKVGSKHAMLAMNLDGFSKVNDEGGRRAGNSLLRKISRLTRGQIGTDGAMTRVHVDEFLVLLTDHSFIDAKRFAERQCRAIANARVAFKDRQFPISVSIGMVPVTRAAPAAERLIEHARAALATAKGRGGNQVRVYDPEEDILPPASSGELTPPEAPVEEDAGADTDTDSSTTNATAPLPVGEPARERITDKLETGELVLRRQRVQPIQGEDEKPHYELLLAIGTVNDDETRALPSNMIPDAEQENLMPEVDRWVIRTALGWMQRSRREVLRSGGYAINLSGSSLSDPKLLEFVVGALTETAVPPAKVIFEVTESAAIDRLSNAVDFIRTLREYGCRFSIDDFGTGHATFTYLKALPVDYVKIDGLFVRELVTNPSDVAMVTSINEISHMLGKKTIAEHVESDEALSQLKVMGVDYAQGYAVGRPELLP